MRVHENWRVSVAILVDSRYNCSRFNLFERELDIKREGGF